ncbi:hypothetical protein M3I54_41130 [Paraburkholderia sp. CNPSo 3274]|uniref:hypothetical protein n=1 Tax=Paraburkholderia sp. CNPSo 3274 TaxID=2940932 RepID=UPI0020B69014|nr:hypothetical protein [Paraburkholderia sp. CNPSo 3274]MCP3713197.1 hypothetical protein [Paraburkholderia sp. CNPSo 3274]
MVDLEQAIHDCMVVAERIKGCLFPPSPVLAGEYALREPSGSAMPWETESGFLPEPDVLPDSLEPSGRFEETNLKDLLDGELLLEPMSVRYGRNDGADRGLLAILGQYFGRPTRTLVQSQTSRAVERLWGGKLRRRTSYVVVDSGWTSSVRLARDFFLAAWRELSDIHRDLASKRALVRALHIRVKSSNAPTAETGSAAAIAKRMNPLGAPPYLV